MWENQSILTKSQGGTFPASLAVRLPSSLSVGCRIDDAHPPEQPGRRLGPARAPRPPQPWKQRGASEPSKSSVTLTFLLN